MIEYDLPMGIILQETPRLLITHCHFYIQKTYVHLDPLDVYCRHIRLPPQLLEGRLSGTQTQDTVAGPTTVHILEQL